MFMTYSECPSYEKRLMSEVMAKYIPLRSWESGCLTMKYWKKNNVLYRLGIFQIKYIVRSKSYKKGSRNAWNLTEPIYQNVELFVALENHMK